MTNVKLALEFWLFVTFTPFTILGGYHTYRIIKWFNEWLDHKAGNDKDPLYLEYKEWVRQRSKKGSTYFGMDFETWKKRFKK